MAIGQGEILATPLQIATFISAIANGGTLYRPALVEATKALNSDPVQLFEPEATGELPISEKTLQTVLEAMRLVVEDSAGQLTGRCVIWILPFPVRPARPRPRPEIRTPGLPAYS